ncbi:MAG: hypothetical protein IT438_14405 [Phycisphaerales bacterium]|nr:hypothetical protein [Phycisphaerales bacterium]
MNADWDDLDASVIIGSRAIRAVVVQSETIDPTIRRYQLRLFDGQDGTLTATRESAAPEGDEQSEPPTDFTLHAVIGRFSDSRVETDLLRATTHRLRQLRGVEFAPLD